VELETVEAQHISGITAAELKFFRKAAKRTLFDHKGICFVISTTAEVSGYNMLVEWIDQARQRLV
jgi:hypothetical protein